jgi:hypothetical protein
VTLEEWEEEKDRELDERLTRLFQAVERPEASAGFASKTMKAVRLAQLAAGRQELRRPWTTPAGWAALVAGIVAALYGIVSTQPAIVAAFAMLVAGGIRAGIWLVRSVHVSVAMFDLLSTAGGAVARVMSTGEAAAGLTLMLGIAGFSLSMLQRLLFSEKGPSS